MEENKEKIIKLFNEKIKNTPIIIDKEHHGKEGHFLEKQMGLKYNCNTSADIYGYEMKKYSKVITYGDYSATNYLFSKNTELLDKLNYPYTFGKITRKDFIKYFGSKKNERYSWSGKCIPKNFEYNEYGQKFFIDDNLNISIKYCYDKDERKLKDIPEFVGKEFFIAIWDASILKEKINNKFGVKGFFLCKKENNFFTQICFGKPFYYEFFIENFKKGNIYFDSGMYETNSRNYSMFRSKSSFWNDLIEEIY